MSPRLSTRLQAVADQVLPGSPMADIGCDHAQLAAALVTAGRVPRAIASDVRPGPLQGAAALVERLRIDVEIRQGSGLTTLEPREVATIVIAGMGGPRMMQLLDASPAVLEFTERVVLQPNTSWTDVRGALAQRGWGLDAETLCEEDGHRYLTLAFDPRKRDATWTVTDVLLGPLLCRDQPAEFREWLIAELDRLHALASSLGERLGKDHPRVHEVLEELRQLGDAARSSSIELTNRCT